MTKIAIIGGGASGLACAIEIMRTVKNKGDVQVTILERLPRVGKKILVTGNGRCNLTNINASAKNYRGDADFTEYALDKYSPQNNIKFFNSLGLYTRTEDEGRVYPLSNQASSVLDALRFECARLGIETICDYRAVHLKTVYTGVTTKIIVNNRDRFDYVVVACGGMTCKAHGTDGDAYDLLKMFGHKIISPAPALVSLNCDEFTKALKGVRAICKMDLIIDGNKALENYGEVQFTDYGLSGIPIMQLSRFVSVSPSNDICIKLDVTPDFSAEEIRKYLYSRREIDKGLCENMLSGIMNKQLCIVLMKECDIQVNGRINELTDNEIEKLANIIKCWKIKIKNSRSFDYAQVTAGGADCSQFNTETMESTLVPNVFCCGEALNIDGDCGGYNLQWAWSSGRLAGNTIAERINNAQN
jgi:predicted Rossmann fold flavoprotein